MMSSISQGREAGGGGSQVWLSPVEAEVKEEEVEASLEE
jgi:hypothetical protein